MAWQILMRWLTLESWGGTGVSEAAYLAIQKLELFHRLPHHPKLIRMYETLFGKAVLPHPRNIARLMVPSPGAVPTPIHQDFIHIQGTRNVWTAWIPFGDIPRALGWAGGAQGLAQAGRAGRHGGRRAPAAWSRSCATSTCLGSSTTTRSGMC